MNDKKVVRFGLVGPGGIAKKFADAVSQCADVELVAVCSRSIERAEAYAKEYGVPKVYDDYQAMIHDPDIDAIYVATPHMFHAEHSIAAMRCKKAVLCEKAAAVNLAQMQEMIAVAKEENVLFMEALWSRFLPPVLQAHKWIAEGRIGDVRLVEGSFSLCAPKNPEGRLYNRALAGGALLDTGIYVITFLLDFGAGALKKFSGMAQIGETGVDEIATLQMQFENGMLAAGSCGIAAKSRREGVIHGTSGMIKIPMFWATHHAELYSQKGNLVDVCHDENENGFCYEVSHFVQLMQEGKLESPRMPWSESLRAAEIYDTLLTEWGIAFA